MTSNVVSWANFSKTGFLNLGLPNGVRLVYNLHMTSFSRDGGFHSQTSHEHALYTLVAMPLRGMSSVHMPPSRRVPERYLHRKS